MEINLTKKPTNADIFITTFAKSDKITNIFSSSVTKQIKNAIGSKDFEGNEEDTLLIYDNDPHKRILIIGIGEKKELEAENYKIAGANAMKAIKNMNISTVDIQIDEEHTASFVEGFILGGYQFDIYKTKKADSKKADIKTINIINSNTANKNLKEKINEVKENCDLLFYVRNLVNMPADHMGPQEIVNEAKKLQKLSKNLKVTVFDNKQIQKMGMGALYAVGKGSTRGTYLIILEYKNKTKNTKPYAFVGKGISFDTGGLNMKPSKFIEHMHLDMAGAAIVLGLFKKLAVSDAHGYFIGAIAAAENSVGPDSYKPNDILTTYNGKTVEITNTDAEGRLVLCDALSYVCKKYKPQFVIDLATLTGAAIVALGHEIGALISPYQDLADKILTASKKSEEMFWQLPIHKFHIKATKGKKADLINATHDMPCGTIMGAAFLANFIEENIAWAHLDIASVSWLHKPHAPYYSEGASAISLKTLIQLVKDIK